MKYFFLFFFILFSLSLTVSPVRASTCTQRTYNECEEGNPTYCLSHGVPKGDIAQVTVHADCSYSCVNLGPCHPTPTPTTKPTATATPTPSPTPTNTPTTASTSPTTTSSPTTTLSPSPGTSVTPTPTFAATTGSVGFHFEGIDPENNPTPHHPQRQVNLYFYTTNTFSAQPTYTVPIIVTFAQSDPNGLFTNNTFDLSSVLPGTYYVLAKSPEGSLREILNDAQPITIVAGQSNPMISQSASTQYGNLRMGDVDGDNSVTLTDYSVLVDCYGTKATSPSCTSHNLSDQTKGIYADINDDGQVDGIDYNILLRHFGTSGY